MTETKGKVIKAGKDRKGRIRKFVEIPILYSDDFEFGDIVKIEKVKDVSQESG